MSNLTQRHAQTVAVITGGAQGVGFAIARQLVEEGCRRLMLAGRDTDKGAKAVAELADRGCEARFVSLDLCDVEACRGLIDTAVAEFGAVNALAKAWHLMTRLGHRRQGRICEDRSRRLRGHSVVFPPNNAKGTTG